MSGPIYFVYNALSVPDAGEAPSSCAVDDEHVSVLVRSRDHPSAIDWPLPSSLSRSVLSVGGPALTRNDERHFPDRVVREIVIVPDVADHVFRSVDHVTDVDSFLAASTNMASNPVTSALAQRLRVPAMRYSIDGVLAVLADVFIVSLEAELGDFLPVEADRSEPPPWFTADVRETVRQMHRVDTMLQASIAGRGQRTATSRIGDLPMVLRAIEASRAAQ